MIDRSLTFSCQIWLLSLRMTGNWKICTCARRPLIGSEGSAGRTGKRHAMRAEDDRSLLVASESRQSCWFWGGLRRQLLRGLSGVSQLQFVRSRHGRAPFYLSLAGAATSIIFVATKVLSRQKYGCRDKSFSPHKTSFFVATNTKLLSR